MRVLRVADVTRTLHAGVSRAMLQSGEELGRLGHEVDYLFREDLLKERWPVQSRRMVVPLLIPWHVLRHKRRWAVDIVEIHEPLAGVYAWVASSRLGRHIFSPCVVHSHGLVEPSWRTTLRCRAQSGRRTPLASRVSVAITLLPQVRLGLRRAAQVVVLNDANRSYLVDELGRPAAHVTVTPNGVDAALLALDREPGGGLRVLYLGAWTERKGKSELAAAWALAHRACPSATLTLAGMRLDAPAVLAGFAESCRSSVSVIPELPREEIGHLLSKHDALVLPSWYEGMPLVVLEGAAAGMAIVATDIPGVSDIFRAPDPQLDGALLVPLQDPVALAGAVSRLASDPELLATLQARARQRASGFTWQATAAALEGAYEAALLAAHGCGLPAPSRSSLPQSGTALAEEGQR